MSTTATTTATPRELARAAAEAQLAFERAYNYALHKTAGKDWCNHEIAFQNAGGPAAHRAAKETFAALKAACETWEEARLLYLEACNKLF